MNNVQYNIDIIFKIYCEGSLLVPHPLEIMQITLMNTTGGWTEEQPGCPRDGPQFPPPAPGLAGYGESYLARDETHHPPLLTRLGSTGLVKKANVVGENELVNEYLLCKLCREYIIFHDKTQ